MGDELLKKTGAGNLFMVFGEPDVEIKRVRSNDFSRSGATQVATTEQIVVEIKGVDVYDPTTGQIRSSTTDDIACWFIDTDYSGDSFFVRHAYFLGGKDPFEVSMRAQYEITRRFTAEFSMRPFLVRWPGRTLERLMEWTRDPDPHVRRLCSEGSRPRLPWAMRIPSLVRDPSPTLPILEALRDDPDLYVRRSVANHLGDIAKDHPELAFGICERWVEGASRERRWMIRHAVRLPAKKGVAAALRLRRLAA
jgi:3-methyladenine DNA glycosylase AlkC